MPRQVDGEQFFCFSYKHINVLASLQTKSSLKAQGIMCEEEEWLHAIVKSCSAQTSRFCTADAAIMVHSFGRPEDDGV